MSFGDVLTILIALVLTPVVARRISRAWGLRLPVWPARWPRVRLVVLSSSAAPAPPDTGVAPPVAGPTAEASNRIATPDNAVNAPLPTTPVARSVADTIPAEAREIIRLQAQAEVLARLIKAGLIGQTAAIEKGLECSRSSRADSRYQQALVLIKPLLVDEPQFWGEGATRVPASRPVSGGDAGAEKAAKAGPIGGAAVAVPQT